MSAILDKLRKLLALSKSDNVHEAAAAAAKAQRLMAEHQIAAAELEGEGPQERASVADDPLETLGKRSLVWKEVLASNVAKLHGCHVWRETTLYQGQIEKRLRIVGRASEVATVRYLYAWLTSEIERLVQRHGKGRGARYRTSYRAGAVKGCLAAMREAQQEVRATATTTALARIDERHAEAEAERERSVGAIGKARTATFKSDPHGFDAGYAAGKGLHTGAKLDAATGARLLGGKT